MKLNGLIVLFVFVVWIGVGGVDSEFVMGVVICVVGGVVVIMWVDV